MDRDKCLREKTILECGCIRLDLAAHLAYVDDQPVELTARECALLEVFMQSPGRVLTRTYISEKIWSSNYDFDGNLLGVYMSKLRRKLEALAGKALFKTLRGSGYQLL